MKILLCAATEMEIASTIQFVAAHNMNSIQIVITGIGLLASTYSITKAVATHQPEFILQAGIAGCLDNRLLLGDVVVVSAETVGDIGVKERSGFQSLFDMQFLNAGQPPWTNRQLLNEHSILNSLPYVQATGVTVNEISTDQQQIDYYRNQLNAQVETMEGAALHYIALMEGLPFLQLRSLSNFIGERDKAAWRMKEAIANLNTQLQSIITKHFNA